MKSENKEIHKSAMVSLALIILISIALIVLSIYLVVNKQAKPELSFILVSMVPMIILAKNQIKLNKLLVQQNSFNENKSSENKSSS